MREEIAIIEDEKDILDLVALTLEKAGFYAKKFATGGEFMSYLNKNVPDLVILDLMLPDIDGLDICKNIRQNAKTRFLPLIMLTVKGDEMDKVLGLELGADDYMTKPFSPRELVARVKAVLRRKEKVADVQEIKIDNVLRIDPQKYEIYVYDRKIELTATEFRLLVILAENRRRVFSRDELIDRLWRGEKFVTDRTIDVHIKSLRDKLRAAGELVKSVRGVGYKLE
jgi:two-component system alkaline phosphatase synthesis response regulator PhoP